MSSQSSHQIIIKGKDQTASAFNSIANRAKATAATMRAALGGALAAAGTYLSLRAFTAGAKELGNLSDAAQKSSTSVDDLTRASTAFTILGVNGDINALTKAFSYMEKNTGRSGLRGFYDTLNEIGKIPDAAERSKAAMSAFGRSGLDFMPLINAAHNGTDALESLMAAMPRVPQAAADAGDSAADAMAIASKGVKSIWLQAIGAVCSWFDANFTGGIREAAAQAANWLEFYAKLSVRRCLDWYTRLTEPIKRVGNAIGAFMESSGSWNERWDAAFDIAADMALARETEQQAEKAIWDEREARWRNEFENRKKAIEEAFATGAYERAAFSTAKLNELLSKITLDNQQRKPQIRNSLIMGDSNEANKLAAFGPQFQNETKRQTALLQQIANNTKQTADNTDELTQEEANNVLDY